MQDWRERCFEKLGFTSSKNVSEIILIQIRASLSCCNMVSSKNLDDTFDVSGAYIPLFEFQESSWVTFFNEYSWSKTFLPKGIIAVMSEGRARTVSNYELPNSIDSVVKFVSKTRTLPKAFQIKCSKALN